MSVPSKNVRRKQKRCKTCQKIMLPEMGSHPWMCDQCLENSRDSYMPSQAEIRKHCEKIRAMRTEEIIEQQQFITYPYSPRVYRTPFQG